MNNKIAILDCGTNTFNLLIASVDRSSKTFDILYHNKIPVKLGEGGIQNKLITEEAFARGLDAIIQYQQVCEIYKVEYAKAFATSALRNAVNGQDFIRETASVSNFDIELIDGEREAELIYKGVKLGVKMNEEKVLIVDIGGGSTEFIIANQNKVFWKKSIEIGAARIMQMFKPCDPMNNDDILKITDYFQLHTQEIINICSNLNIVKMVGSSGSFDTLAEMVAYEKGEIFDLDAKSELEFDIASYLRLHELLLKTTYEERLKIPGIISVRAEMIVIASILIKLMIEQINMKKCKVSTFSLKEGFLFEYIEKL